MGERRDGPRPGLGRRDSRAERGRRDLDLKAHPVLVAAAAMLIVAGAVLMVWLLRRAARSRTSLALGERLQFERLLADLSAGLIHIEAREIDSALERGLRQVGTFLGADRGTLDARVDGAAGTRMTWTTPGLEPLPPVLDNVDKFPWTVETLGRGEVVRFARLDELPGGATVDRASYLARGTRAHVSLPLRASGPMLGALSFDAVRAEYSWPDDLVERLRLLSEVFAGALERKRMESLLTQRLRFEALLASLSVALSKVSATEVDRFDQEVQRSLRKVADFLEVDRGGLIEFPRGSEGPARSWAIEERLDVQEFPWTTARLKRGDAVGFSQLEELPAEAAVDRESYLTLRVKSQVAVPLPVGQLVVGGLVFSTVGAERTWPAEVMEQLHLLREVFANTLARRQAELEAQRLRQDLAHIGRVSAMGELTASLAHELNQPLTAILNNAQAAQLLLAAKVVNFETISQILDDIVADDKRAADVIHGLRVLLKRGDPQHVSLDLNDVISEVARLIASDALVRGVPITLELAADLPRVRGDRIQLQQVVLNLVLNGLESMPEATGAERTLVVRTARDGTESVRVEVQDAGSGFDETDVNRLFQPLYTTKAQGLGMGLAIVRTIVEAHGGRLGAVNNERGGATFHFTLPAETESPG
jgi:signal transduction histidine kinase